MHTRCRTLVRGTIKVRCGCAVCCMYSTDRAAENVCVHKLVYPHAVSAACLRLIFCNSCSARRVKNNHSINSIISILLAVF